VIGDTRVVEDRAGLLQRAQHRVRLFPPQYAAEMERGRPALVRRLEHLDQFNLGHAALGKQKRCVTCGLESAFMMRRSASFVISMPGAFWRGGTTGCETTLSMTSTGVSPVNGTVPVSIS